MVQRHFNGNRKGDRQRRPTLHQSSTLESKLARQSYAVVNTAVDFDENRHKLVYHVLTTETLSWNVYMMETRTNCPQERFAHDIILVARAII